MIDHAPRRLASEIFYRSGVALSDQDIIRLCLALAASMLFHALLLGMQRSAVHDRKVDPAASNSQLLNVVLAGKPGQRHEDARQKAVSKRPNNLAARKPLNAKEPKITLKDEPKKSAPKPSTPDSSKPDTSMETQNDPAQPIGMALQSMITQQYMMMRLQQFFAMARRSASKIIKNRFSPNELTHYRGERCTLHLMVSPALEQGYEITQVECDHPDLVTELRAMPWGTAMPLPSEYSLPYRGLVIHLNLGSYDASIGLEPLVN